jgi:hypothetical protein
VIGQFKNKLFIPAAMVAVFFIFPISVAFAKADAKILLNVPVDDFVMPIFDDDGHRMWEARGESAVLGTDESLHVTDMRLSCFTGSNGTTEAFFAVSDAATIIPGTHKALGESKIEIFGENFCASADAWEFFGDSKKIVAKNNVRVLLDGTITGVSR